MLIIERNLFSMGKLGLSRFVFGGGVGDAVLAKRTRQKPTNKFLRTFSKIVKVIQI